MQPCKLQCCIWRDSIKPNLRFSWFCVFFISKGNPFWLLFYSTVAGVVPCGSSKKSLHILSWCRLYLISFGIIEPILVILKIEYSFSRVCSLINYSVAYEETQSKWVSDFCDFVCSLFPKANPFWLSFHKFHAIWFGLAVEKRELEDLQTVKIQTNLHSCAVWAGYLLFSSTERQGINEWWNPKSYYQ